MGGRSSREIRYIYLTARLHSLIPYLGHGNTQDQQDPVLVKTLIGAGASYAALGGDTTFIVDGNCPPASHTTNPLNSKIFSYRKTFWLRIASFHASSSLERGLFLTHPDRLCTSFCPSGRCGGRRQPLLVCIRFVVENVLIRKKTDPAIHIERGMASLVALCIWTIRKHKLYRPNDPQCIKLPAELEQYLL